MAVLGTNDPIKITPGADFTMIVSRYAGTQVITLLGTPTGGTWKAAYRNTTYSANIAYNASAATVQAALEALATIGAGNVAVAGSAGGPWTVTPAGTLAAEAALKTFLVTEIGTDSSGLTGGTSPKADVTIPLKDVSTGYTYELQARATAGSTYPDILVNSDGDPNPGPAGAQGEIDLTDAAAGHLTVHITAAATAALTFTNAEQKNTAHWVLMETETATSERTALQEDGRFTLGLKYFV